jgi:hypothetical protein
MSGGCGFGQIGDMRARSLCIGGKVVVDNKRNLFVKNMKTKSITTSTLTTSSMTTSGPIKTKFLEQETLGQGVVVDRPLISNAHGICRAFLNQDVKLFNTDSVLLDAGQVWTRSFESAVFNDTYDFPPLLLQSTNETEVHLFTTPTQIQYQNICLPTNWVMLVEVNGVFPIVSFNFGMGSSNIYTIKLLKNGVEVSNVSQSSVNDFGFGPINNTDSLTFHDIIECFPGDVLDFEYSIDTNGSFGSITSGSNKCYATFKILSFQTVNVV